MSEGNTEQSGGTQPGDEPNAGESGKYSDEDMAKARRTFEKNAAKATQRAVSSAVAEAKAELLEQLGVESDGDIARIAELAQKASGIEGKAKASERQLAKLQKELSEKAQSEAALRQTIRQGAVERELLAAAEVANAHPKSVLALAMYEKRIGADDAGNVFVLDAEGQPDSDLTVGKYVESLLAENKHLQRPAPNSGGGSQPAGGPNNASVKPAKNAQDLASQLRDAGFKFGR